MQYNDAVESDLNTRKEKQTLSQNLEKMSFSKEEVSQ